MVAIKDRCSVRVSDISGARRVWVRVPADAQIEELVAIGVRRLGLPEADPSGRKTVFQARARGSDLQPSELVGEVFSADDVAEHEMLILPYIEAGGGCY